MKLPKFKYEKSVDESPMYPEGTRKDVFYQLSLGRAYLECGYANRAEMFSGQTMWFIRKDSCNFAIFLDLLRYHFSLSFGISKVWSEEEKKKDKEFTQEILRWRCYCPDCPTHKDKDYEGKIVSDTLPEPKPKIGKSK